MSTERLELVEHFHEMSDAELIDRCGSGTLTEIAQSIAIEELASRGLVVPDRIAKGSDDTPYEGDFETVARFLNPTDAYIVCSCLVAAGIPALVADANLAQMNSLWTVAIGGTRVLVTAAHFAEARKVIEAFNRGDFALTDGGDSSDALR